MKIFKRLVFSVICCCYFSNVIALPDLVIEKDTSTLINNLKHSADKAKLAKKNIGEIVSWISLQLLNQPYKARLLDQKTPEYLYISLSNTDCMLFIEEVLAVAKLIKVNQLDLKHYIQEIAKLRYHGNIAYCQRNHYFKDWASINIQQKIISDEGFKLSGITYNYPANSMSTYLKNHLEDIHYQDLPCIEAREDYINREEKIGFIPIQDLNKYLPKIKSGDIVGIVRVPKGRADAVHHLGIIYINKGVVTMVDASSIQHKVIVEDSLLGYLAKFKDSQGIVLFRPQ